MEHSKLKKQQRLQLQILVDFDAFCKQNGLVYFMIYGTLLGAIRHKGFIPWDYDIDTVMTRAEYERFRAIQHSLPAHLSIQEICYSDIDHAGLARIIYHDNELGDVHVDIFILDYQRKGWRGKSMVKYFCKLLHFAKLSKLEKSYLIKGFKGQPLKQAVVYFSKVLRLLVGGSARAERLIFKLRVSKVPTDTYIVLECKKPLPVKYFTKPELLDFDNYKFYSPSSPEDLLTLIYGNYMEIPPEGQHWMKEEESQNNLRKNPL